MQPQLGERLRALRMAKGYTLTQVASLARVSPSFLSMLETGKTNVAAERLHAIAQVYGLRASDLLPAGDAHALIHAVRATQRPAIKLGQNGVAGQLLTRDLHRRIQPVLLTLEGGASHENPLGHPGEEFIFVVRGRLLLTVDGDQRTVLEAGDSASYPSSLSHAYQNLDEEPAEVLTISVPPKSI